MSPAEILAVADGLYQQARALNPGWPTPEDREEDLRSHIRVAELLQRAYEARRR
jgi:hypothetical protein